ncbi:MAG: hypothetical protein AB8A37_10370 [Prochlorococcus sp.]|nr:hypothetical protein [Prochlorococcaceae cyanobacterium ETNP18_MAG_14]
MSDASKTFTVNKRAVKQHHSDKKLPNGIQKAIRAEKHDSTNHAGESSRDSESSRGNAEELFTSKMGLSTPAQFTNSIIKIFTLMATNGCNQ